MYKISFAIIGILGIAFIILVILSCCKVSSDSERQFEEWHRKEKKDE